ncbi:MAG: hypothetical protein DSZ28_07620 [Thiothrix sp.]|nr:MAG: hypothetical protein DSZ28_07620 [Thiothrix sp.]
MLLMVMATFCMIFVHYGASLALFEVATSDCFRNVGMALAGKGMQMPLNNTVLLAGSSYCGYSLDLSALIRLAGDVELNPGPGLTATDLEKALKAQREDIRKDIADMKRDVTETVTTETRKLNEQLQEMSRKLDGLQTELTRLDERVVAQADDLEDLRRTCDAYDQRIADLEEKLEEMERRDRRDNVILYGIPEADNERYADCQTKFVEAVEEVLPGKLKYGDVVRAHRIGKKRADKCRPLIARLVRTVDKLAVLSAREKFKACGKGVSNDLTEMQRRMVQQAREDGNLGYFRGARFFTEPRQRSDDAEMRTTATHDQPAVDRRLTRSTAGRAGAGASTQGHGR